MRYSNVCQSCRKEAGVMIMSMYDDRMVCMSCKAKEKTRPDYADAERKDLQEYAGRLDSLGMTKQADSVRDFATRIK